MVVTAVGFLILQGMAEEAPRRRRDVPKLHVGLLVRVGENCRSPC